jgi:hypothetical protein
MLSLQSAELLVEEQLDLMGKASSTGYFLMGVTILVLLATACSPAAPTLAPTPTPTSMTMGQMTSEPADGSKGADEYAPLVKGFYQGGEVQFIHTEASDPQVASMLTMMMGPEVVLVPGLAESPGPVLAEVYVFTNGIEGSGPFGFQPDVFDSAPDDEAYSPLRSVNLVAWAEGATPRELRSAEEVKAAEAGGEITIERPGVVVNMPILVWPGGQR